MTLLPRAAAFGIVVGSLALAHSANAQETFRVGAVNPFSGPMAQYGVEVTRGFEMAADKVNAGGGLLGRKVEIVHSDASNAQQGIQAVETVMNKGKVDVFAGTYTSAISNTASDAAMRFNKIYLETIALAEELTDHGLLNYVRTGPNAGTFAAATVDTLRDLALMGRDGSVPSAAYQALIYPVLDLTAQSESYHSVTSGVPLTADTMHYFIGHYTPIDSDRLDWRASPLLARSLAGTLPALVVSVAHDPLCAEARAYADRLERDGVRVTALHLSDQMHGMLMHGKVIRASNCVLAFVAAMIGEALHTGPPAA